MSKPIAYEPQAGYRYQILTRNPAYSRAWEACDYAATASERKTLVSEYRTAYGAGWEFKSILLPAKFWPTV